MQEEIKPVNDMLELAIPETALLETL